MESADHNNRGTFGHTIIFIGCCIIAATMLMMALTLLLADWLGSLLMALTLLGGFFTFVALILYWCSVRPTLQQLRSEIELISKIAQQIHNGCNWLTTQICALFSKTL